MRLACPPHPNLPPPGGKENKKDIHFEKSPKVLQYAVKDMHGTVLGDGIIPARASPCSASWTTSAYSSAGVR